MDCRQQLRRAARDGVLIVQVTKHALQRIVERQPKLAERKMEEILDVFRNVVKQGKFKADTTRVLVWTKNYVLLCTFNLEGKLVVKTVVTRATLQEKMERALSRGIAVQWKYVAVEPVERE